MTRKKKTDQKAPAKMAFPKPQEAPKVKVEAPNLAPVPMRGVLALTDGTRVHIHEQTCSNLELGQIGNRLVLTAQERERASAQAWRQAQQPAQEPVKEAAK